MASSNDRPDLTREQIKHIQKLYSDLANEASRGAPGTANFELGPNPFFGYDDDLPPARNEFKFRIFIKPGGDVFQRRPVPLEITLISGFPLDPPLVQSLQELFHPNIDLQGRVCAPFLLATNCYDNQMTLIELVNKLIDLFEHPSESDPQNPEAAGLWQTNLEQYNTRARNILKRS